MKKLLLLLGLSLTTSSFAVIPVIDHVAIANMVQEIMQLQQQYETLLKTYENAKEQLAQQKHLVSELEGHYHYGDLFNRDIDEREREWSSNNWDDALQGLSGGNPQRYEELKKLYHRDNPPVEREEFLKGASPELADQYQKMDSVNLAAFEEANHAYEEVNQHLKAVRELAEAIETTPNTKAAIDLNSRIQAEVAFIALEQQRMQAIINLQISRESSNEIDSMKRISKFNRVRED